MTGGTFEAGPKIVVKDWMFWTADADEPWTEQELEEFGRDFLLIQALPEVSSA